MSRGLRDSQNTIVFRAADTLRPFVTRNAELLGMLAPQFEEELKQENGDEDFIERVRIAVQQKLTGRRPTIEDIADALHTSSRTLQRRLQDLGSSFQRVLEEARHQLARHYLNNSFLELNEAAYLLGYADGNLSSRLPHLGGSSTGPLARTTTCASGIVVGPHP